MKEDKFVKENSETWLKLEATLKKLKSKGLKRLERNELDELITLYNHACGHLSYSRTYYGSSNTTVYLNRLVSSAHNYIYTTKTSGLKNLFLFLLRDFPLLVVDNLSFLIVSTAVLILGMAASFALTLFAPDNAFAFLPNSYIEGVKGGGSGSWDSSLMSSFILTNNIRVGFTAFAAGITAGILTVFILIQNGFMVGALAALAHMNGMGYRFWSLILPHGIIELFAIFVCGAAGLIIGYSIINPGIYSRKDSVIMRGKVGIKLVCGTIPLFVIAGFIEGFITPMNIPEILKYIFACITLVLLIIYIVVPNLIYRNNKPFKPY